MANTSPALAPATCDEYLATLPWVDASPVQRELIEASIRRMWGMLERRVKLVTLQSCRNIASGYVVDSREYRFRDDPAHDIADDIAEEIGDLFTEETTT